MGGVFSFLQSVDVSDVYVDFKAAQPSENEEKLCESVQELLSKKGADALASLRDYKACGPEIKSALSDPTPENEKVAFDAVKANVALINSLYEISLELSELFPQLLSVLATDDEKRSIQEQQAISKQMADIIEFVLKADELKMMKPGLQNDFAFYKRSLGKHGDDEELIVKDEVAGVISMYIAQPIPMMNTLAKATKALASDNDFVSKTLATMANVCLHLAKDEAFEDESTNVLCVKTMVGCIVLFDHVDPEGAFVRHSGINIKQAVQLLTKEYSHMPTLVNALRFSTIHYNDDSTPSSITELLEG